MISFDNFILLQSVLLELQHDWLLCYNHILLLLSILIFELCIMIIWLLFQSISLLDCMMVSSCVTIMILFISNYPLRTFEKPLYAHNNNVIVNIFWKYVGFWIWYEHGKIWIWMYSPPSLNWWYWQFYEMRKINVFPTIIILNFHGILW